MIYDIRNKRNAAHLANGIDPNIQDASLVIHNMEWVLAELVRQFHSVSPDVAHGIISDLVAKEVPVIQMFGDFPRILKRMSAPDYCLSLLYRRGANGATFEELFGWVKPAMRKHLRQTLKRLDDRDLVHLHGDQYMLTTPGEVDVENRRLLEP